MKSHEPVQQEIHDSGASDVQKSEAAPAPFGSPGWALQAQGGYGNAFVQAMLAEEAVQAEGGQPGGDVHAAAAEGVKGGGGALPHLDAIQSSFGSHDVTGVQAHVGGAAATASKSMGAEAYATGNSVAFKESPSLHTAAHEAAHVVQQRNGVSLKGGVGQVGDKYEQHADQVADAVVQGKSAEGILDTMAGGGSGGGVQHKAVQLDAGETTTPEHDASEFSGDKDKLKILKEAITTALTMVTAALGKSKLGDATYMTWMDGGAKADATDEATKNRLAHVRSGFDKIKKCLEKDKVIFKEWDDADKTDYDNTYAYVYQGQKENNIYLGGAFWVAANAGIDSRAGTIIHELTHHLHGTDDHHYGAESSKDSAKNAPATATTNADNYEHFSESA